MTKQVRVPLDPQFRRFAIIDLDALAGATVGVNLRFPDGRLVQVEDLGSGVPAGSAVILWTDVSEKPQNITEAADLAGAGLVVRAGTGEWSTQPLYGLAPAGLGVAAPGTSAAPARGDHVHGMPTAADVGADENGTAASAVDAHESDADPHPQYFQKPDPLPTITGSRGGNAALASLLTEGATIGLWVDGTTA